MSQPIFIAIAGGSGAGKSTLAHAFVDTNSDHARVLHLDDYRKEKELVPRSGTFINWDHPDTIYWDRLERDLSRLQQGQSVLVQKKHERFDSYGLAQDETVRVVEPVRFILLDGYLALFSPSVRSYFDCSVFLDLSNEQRIARRKKFDDMEDSHAYFDAVLIPMHNEFVEPTKQYADLIIDVENVSREDVLTQFSDILVQRFGAS